jgi:hypothetical protein
MIRKEDIPEVAICHFCGEPMKVIDVTTLARSLGYEVRTGTYAVECCGFEQAIDDRTVAERVAEILVAYHAQNAD